MIDLRSDTVTKPCEGMRDAMFNAPVGDDVFREDPTVNELESFAAELFGKEAALFCSSGTQTNQIAINVHVQPGDEVITHVESHVYKYEGGGIARNSGASVRLLDGNRGRLKLEDVQSWFNNPEDVHLPLTRLVSLEDTANRGGGAIYDFEEIKRISAYCKSMGMPLHLDGARLMNAIVENGVELKTYSAEYDTISLCLSKGLGAPVGSVLIGPADFIHKARRVRKVFGGGMRQAGFLAAAGLYALKNNVNRLKIDHEHARVLGAAFESKSWIKEVYPVDTNIVVAVLQDASKRDLIIQRFLDEGVRVIAFGPGMIRMVTHLDISESDVAKVNDLIRNLEV